MNEDEKLKKKVAMEFEDLIPASISKKGLSELRTRLAEKEARIAELETGIENVIKRLQHFPSPDNLEEQREHNHHRAVKQLLALQKAKPK